MVISPLGDSPDNNQPRSVTKPLQSRSGLTILPIFPDKIKIVYNLF